MSALRVLVCGGRDFNDAELLGSWLGGIHNQRGIACLIEGGQRGADRMARMFAEWKGIPVKTVDADWTARGRAAGPLRNQRMLDEERPDLVVAFPGGIGTADMVRRARQTGVLVLDVASPESIAVYRAAQIAFGIAP